MGCRLWLWVSSLSLSQPFIEKFADKITDNFDNQYDTHTQANTITHRHTDITTHELTDQEYKKKNFGLRKIDGKIDVVIKYAATQ